MPENAAAVSRKPKLLEAGHPDNFQTPASALDCLLPWLRTGWTIWEPACGKGNLVRGLMQHGYEVIGTDKAIDGQDFTTAPAPDPASFDCVLTNPPFSIKEKFLARCYALGKPFALLLPITTFDSKERRRLFARHGVQIVLPDGRVNFETPNDKGSSAWFYTAWFTHGLNLPKQLNFHGLERELV